MTAPLARRDFLRGLTTPTRLILRLRLMALQHRVHHELTRSHVCERWAEEAYKRAKGDAAEAVMIAGRLGLIRID